MILCKWLAFSIDYIYLDKLNDQYLLVYTSLVCSQRVTYIKLANREIQYKQTISTDVSMTFTIFISTDYYTHNSGKLHCIHGLLWKRWNTTQYFLCRMGEEKKHALNGNKWRKTWNVLYDVTMFVPLHCFSLEFVRIYWNWMPNVELDPMHCDADKHKHHQFDMCSKSKIDFCSIQAVETTDFDPYHC